jgi:hypothetical protein
MPSNSTGPLLEHLVTRLLIGDFSGVTLSIEWFELPDRKRDVSLSSSVTMNA